MLGHASMNPKHSLRSQDVQHEGLAGAGHESCTTSRKVGIQPGLIAVI